MSMIYMQASSFGKTIAVFNRIKGMEDSTKLVRPDAVIYSGRALSLRPNVDANQGTLQPTLSNILVYGLAKFQKNSYLDEVVDDYGFYGSKKGTVILSGIVEVTDNVFTDPAGVETTVHTYDTTLTYAPGQPLYVDLTSGDPAIIGTITNVVGAPNDATFLGYCLAVDTTNKVLQILLAKPSA